MADISKVTVGGTTYNIKDAQARTDIEALQNSVTGGMHYLGSVIDPASITDASATVAYIKTGDTTANAYYTGTKPTGTTYSFGGVTYTLTYIALKAGDLVISGTREYVFSDADNKWHEFGSTGSLKALAFKDSASGTFKPKGTVASTFTGTQQTQKHTVTNAGSVSASGTFTPEGTVTQGTKTTATVVKSYPGAKSKMVQTSVHDTPVAKNVALQSKDFLVQAKPVTQKLVKTSITGVSGSTKASKASASSVPGMTAAVSGETLTLTQSTVSFSEVAVPVAASAVSVATGAVSASGTGSEVCTGITEAKESAVYELAGGLTEVTVGLIEGTPITVATGELGASGTGYEVLTGLGTAQTETVIKTVGNPTFTGTQKTVNVTGTNSGVVIADHTITPSGTVASTFTGTSETVTVQ